MRRLFIVILILFSTVLQAQQVPIFFTYENDGDTFNVCDGFIFDSGGQGGPGYSNFEYITITICPDTISEGDNDLYITTTFNVFELDETNTGTTENPDLDAMTVYNGPNIDSPTYGTYYGDELQNVAIAANNMNESGCLTFVFRANGSGTGTFTGNAVCAQPCDPPMVDAFIVDGDAPDSISVCVGTSVTFDGSASTGSDGFGISEYNWNFADGNVELSSGPIVSHVFTAPGEYPVLLTVIDDNESNACTSLNVVPLNVYVSNYPTYDQFPSDMTICIGEVVDLVGIYDFGVYDSTWTGFPQNFPINGCLPDTLLGVAQSFPFTYTEFDPSAVISSVDDVGDICVNMEHSYMGDLVIQLSCPNGTTITLQAQGGGGTQIGVPHQADSVDCPNGIGIGEGWDYCWNASAEQTWTEWVNSQIGFGFTLPEGTYAPYDPMSELIGCPLIGTWQLTVIDNWAADDGQIFEFGVGFAKSFYQENVQFTNTIGEDADSSSWDLSGPYIISNTVDLNHIIIHPETIGSYEYDYWVVNDFGCEFDTTVTVDVIEGPEITAGPDLISCSDLVQLEGSLVGVSAPSCSNDGGVFTYCYGNNEQLVVTYCPDVPGDGTTMMSLEFLGGELDNLGDWITIHNGESALSPWIDSPWIEDLTGLGYTADNPSGCITITINSNGVNSCEDGALLPIEVSVGCTTVDDGMLWSWDPPTGLTNPNVLRPFAEVNQATTYTLSGYPIGFPACTKMDQMELNLLPFEAVIDTIFGPLNYCYGDGLTYAVESIEGAESYEWTLPTGWTGQSMDEFILSFGNASGIVGVRAFDGCGYTAPYELEVVGDTVPVPTVFTSGETLICLGADSAYTYSVLDYGPSYHWTITGADVSELTTGENVIDVQWEEEGLQTISVFASNGCGDGPVAQMEVEVSYCLGVDNTARGKELFELWPNPSDGAVFIKGDLMDTGMISVKVMNLLGQEVLKTPVSDNGHFDLNKLPSSVYLIQVFEDGDLKQISRLLKQ